MTLHDLTGIVRTAVVYYYDLKIRPVLSQHGIERAGDERGAVVGRDDDAERGHGG
jgi:hypothetical protein